MSYRYDAANHHSTALNKLDVSRQIYFTAINHNKLLEVYGQHFQQLLKDGIFSDETQINPVVNDNYLIDKSKISDIKYHYDQSLEFNSVHLSSIFPGISVNILPLTLTMQLLHEGDLYTLLNSIEDSSSRLFDIQSCSITRNRSFSTSQLVVADNNFSARCKLNWYTISYRSTKAVLLNRKQK